MRPGRGLKSSSRVVIAESAPADHRDGAWRIEIVGVSGESASPPGGPDAENVPSDQPHAPCRRRRFYLAVHGRRVSVRFPHGSADMPWRSISGSFACWRISGGVETIREQG